MDKDNANPTILSASQLPTRHRVVRKRRVGPEAIYDSVIFDRPAYLQAENSGSLGTWDAVFGSGSDDEDYAEEPIDEQEIYDLISSISDPEHPLSLGQLAVVNLPDISIQSYPPLTTAVQSRPTTLTRVLVEVTPTITHCSLATVIGLAVRVRLEQTLPPHFRVDVRVKEGTHAQDDQVNKQLSDKERVAAALENQDLRALLDRMLATCI